MGTVLSLFLPFCLSQATSCFQFDIYSTKGHEVQSSEPLVIYQESKECYCLYVSDPIVADSRFWSQTIVLRQPNSEKSSVNKKTTSGDLWTYHPCVLTLCWPWPIVPMVQEPHRMMIRAPSVILTLSRTMIRGMPYHHQRSSIELDLDHNIITLVIQPVVGGPPGWGDVTGIWAPTSNARLEKSIGTGIQRRGPLDMWDEARLANLAQISQSNFAVRFRY